MSTRERVAVIGAGIVGLAHAWSAAERGRSVTVFERHHFASGASIRNFGMVWPIGQPHGELYQTALASRERWLQLEREAGIAVNPCGSIHLAHHPDEWQVLQQFAALSSSLKVACQLLNPNEIHQQTPAANSTGLLGGLLSPSELCVNPREAVRSLPRWLEERHHVRFYFNSRIVSLDQISKNHAGTTGYAIDVKTACGRRFEFDRVIICCGAELMSLYPLILQASGLVRCKLQMLSLRPDNPHWRQGPLLASGLTLRHYRIFEVCPSLNDVRQRIAADFPELNQYGIHVMAAQNNHGDVILGDSHEYGDDIDPFDKSLIENLILRELSKVFCLPPGQIHQRWHGIYAKHPTLPVFEATPIPDVHLFTGTGGAGMTMAFGLAEQFWNRFDNRSGLAS